MAEPGTKLEIYLANRKALVDYAAPIVGGRAQAEDVVQDAWLRFDGRDASPIQQPVAYLYRIVRNLAVDLTRRLHTDKYQADGAELLATLPADTPSPEHQLYRQDELRQLESAMAQLPERTRIAFEMHRLGGCTLQQVANHLGISIGLVHQLVRTALTHCAEQLGEDDD
jgi:RNA polymerase sigma factor (sigma-70 family)